MRPRNEYHDARRMLVHLMRLPGDGKVSTDTVSSTDMEFLKATCAITVLMYQICYMAGFDAKRAVEGFEALTVDVKKKIYDICDEELPT